MAGWALSSNKATKKASQQESTLAVDKAKAATIDEFTKGIDFKKDNIIELSGIKTEDDFMQQIGKDNIDVLVTKPYSDSGKNWITIYIMSSKKEFWEKIANELRKSSDICAFFNFDRLASTGFCSWWSGKSSFENSLDSQTIAERLVVGTINAFDKDVRVAIADMNDYYIDNFMRTENVTLRNNLVAKFDAKRKSEHGSNDFNNTLAPIAPSASLPVVSYSSSRAAIPAKSDAECSKSIVKKMVAEISLRLTSSNGMYRLKNVNFSDETIQNMANYITSNSIKQGRAKDDLSDKIYGLCVTNLQEYKNRSVEIVYTPSVEPEGLGNFTGRILEEPKFAHHSPFKDLVDYSEMDRSFIDYSELDTSFVDYSEN